MSTPAGSGAAGNSRAFAAIVTGGLACGVLDITAAFLRWGFRDGKGIRILQSIASGLLGTKSFQGGLGTAALGLAFHFLIATSWAAVFFLASRKLTFLVRRPVTWGFLYGIAVYMFMAWIVVPLSAFPKSTAPFSITA